MKEGKINCNGNQSKPTTKPSAMKQFYVESLLDSTALPADKALLQLNQDHQGIPWK
jgi:hypothetical protein